jgi:hypothetical protein
VRFLYTRARPNKAQTTYFPRLFEINWKNNISVLPYSCRARTVTRNAELLEKRADLEDQLPVQWKISLRKIIDLVLTHLDDMLSKGIRIIDEKFGIQSSRSTSGPRFILLVTAWNMRRFSRLDGSGNSIFLSSRPGRSKAGSSVSARFVAIMTYHGSIELRIFEIRLESVCLP